MKSKARCFLLLCLLFSLALLVGCAGEKSDKMTWTPGAIAVCDLVNNQISFIHVDHTTGEVTRWTTENVPLGDIYNLPLNTN